MKRMDRSLFDAALILQKNRRQTLFRVHLPLLSGAYAGAGLLAAVLTAGELGATLLLVPPGAGTLTLKIYNYLHYGQSEVVSGLCLLLYLIALSIGFILQRVSAPKLRRPA
jgi:iron(III) transport system permease protein